MKRVTVADAPAVLNTNDKAFWAIGWNDCAEAAEAAVKQARIDALEEARNACSMIAVDKWALYKGRPPYTGQEPDRASDYTQGQSDGAEMCDQAIESLKGQP